MAEVVENFFGVYLLYCKNPKFFGRTYIGFTVNPNRRINQHNKGIKSGGARRTSNKGPWTMVLIVHGFPNEISALRFEWAWQRPEKSRRLNHLPKKKPREKMYEFNIRILLEMLKVGPWNRLPLTLRWLSHEYMKDFSANDHPPLHMPIVFGHVVSKKVSKECGTTSSVECDTSLDLPTCSICHDPVEPDEQLTCLDNFCPLVAHITCLSKRFLSNEPGNNIPIEGTCPLCKEQLLWGDLVRKKNGCYADLVPADNSEEDRDTETE